MAQALPVGPYKWLSIDGQRAPWYIIPFDRDGNCVGPKTRDDLIKTAANGSFTDVFVFSHGWNNDWQAASERYDDFISKYAELRKNNGLGYPRAYQPLLIGIFWPSTALVMPWEAAPKIAASPGQPTELNQEVGELQDQIYELAELLPRERRPRFYELVQGDEPLAAKEREELATMLAPVWGQLQGNPVGEFGANDVALNAHELVELWGTSNSNGSFSEVEGGYAPDRRSAQKQPGSEPVAAFSLGDMLSKPRDLLRAFTVLQMKDRAATVGAKGVGPLLCDLMSRTESARFHLIGHSYGAVVMLSALCYPQDSDFTREVSSVLLLQPAVSRFCFAKHIPKRNYVGGYRSAFERCTQPILTTFSSHDVPLTKLFHLAVRRDRDLGQPQIAGTPAAPSDYAALGGYGPDGCDTAECRYEAIHEVGTRYELSDSATRVIALKADSAIAGHGEVSVPETWWALYNQVTANA
jgi:pimeloyl-ACP methyl ester carboxylesterase